MMNTTDIYTDYPLAQGTMYMYKSKMTFPLKESDYGMAS